MVEIFKRNIDDWWSDWWARDFSWTGLIQQPLKGWIVNTAGILIPDSTGENGRAANMQDYWRRGAGSGRCDDRRPDAEIDQQLIADGELIKGPNDELWHIAHVPPTWRDGTRTDKRACANLKDAPEAKFILARLSASRSTEFDQDTGEWVGVDGRARLDGAVITYWPEELGKSVNIVSVKAAYLCSLSNRGAVFGPGCNFDRSYFWQFKLDDCTFEGRHPKEYVSFDYVLCEQGLSFIKCKFETDFQCIESLIFGNSDASETEFKALAHFGRTSFLDYSAYNSDWGDLKCRQAKFGGPAVFYCANLSGCIFDESTFLSDADFTAATFQRPAWFSGARFEAEASFINSRWVEGGGFANAVFNGTPAFEGAALHSNLTFDGTGFRALRTILKRVRARLFVCANIIWITAFVGLMTFGLATKLHGIGWFIATAVWQIATVVILLVAVFSVLQSALWPSYDSDDDLERLIRAFRNLSAQFAALNNRREAAKFKQLEMRTARLRAGGGMARAIFVNGPERVLSFLYDVVANYGESIFKPIMFFIISMVFFGLVYFGIDQYDTSGVRSAVPPGEGQPFLQAMDLSVSRAVPFGPWHDLKGGSGCELRARVLGEVDVHGHPCTPVRLHASGAKNASSWWRLARMLAALQTFISGVLAFLCALAVRRRFQIS